MKTNFDRLADEYNKNGYSVFHCFNEVQVNKLKCFAEEWLYSLLAPWTKDNMEQYPLQNYHKWGEQLKVDHNNIFCAKNRHCIPNDEIKKIIFNSNLEAFLNNIGVRKYIEWDEGLGWFAFRFIRPNMNDGYPLSCKMWGPANNVISFWIPVFGHSSLETLLIVPGSHRKNYKYYLPKNTKFTKSEFRLNENIDENKMIRPSLKSGDIIAYHPLLLHSENVEYSNITRLSLEYRINPVKE